MKNNQVKVVFFWEKNLANGAVLATKKNGLFWSNFWFVLVGDSLRAFLRRVLKREEQPLIEIIVGVFS